jgi:hypothetical protein
MKLFFILVYCALSYLINWNCKFIVDLFFTDGYSKYLETKIAVLRRGFLLCRKRVRFLKKRNNVLKKENCDLKLVIRRHERFYFNWFFCFEAETLLPAFVIVYKSKTLCHVFFLYCCLNRNIMSRLWFVFVVVIRGCLHVMIERRV